jgi:predicted nucleotidyltransferase
MDLTRPEAALIPSLDAEVLMVLASTSRWLTGHDVGRLVRRGSLSGVRKVLHRLASHGLVNVEEAGPALLYSLNRDHLAAPLVEALGRIRTDLFDRIRAQITAWEVPPVSAAVFGSAARGDGDVDSDIDILLVRPNQMDEDDRVWRAQISDLSTAIGRWTGNRASMIEASVAETRAMFERGEPIARELVRDAVQLAGSRLTDVMTG